MPMKGTYETIYPSAENPLGLALVPFVTSDDVVASEVESLVYVGEFTPDVPIRTKLSVVLGVV